MSIQQVEEVEGEETPTPSARAAELARLSPSRAALELAWPGIIEQSVSALGTAIVFAFVGHLGATATAGVGAAGNFLFLMFPVWRSLAIGTIAVVSRRMGEGRSTEAADATRQSLLLGAGAGVLFGAFFVTFSAPLLRLLGADDEIVAIETDAAPAAGATVWRFAHTRSNIVNDTNPSALWFWYTPRPNVSPNGRFVIFTSNWEKTLGVDPADKTYREDVYLVQLQ